MLGPYFLERSIGLELERGGVHVIRLHSGLCFLAFELMFEQSLDEKYRQSMEQFDGSFIRRRKSFPTVLSRHLFKVVGTVRTS